MLDYFLAAFFIMCILKGIKSGPIFGLFSTVLLGISLCFSILYSDTYSMILESKIPFFTFQQWQTILFISTALSCLFIYLILKQFLKLIPFIRPKHFIANCIGACLGSLYALLLTCFFIIPLETQFPQHIERSLFSHWISFQIRPILVDIKKLSGYSPEMLLRISKKKLTEKGD